MTIPLVAALQQSLGDRYRIERELGAGGMATVFLAEDLKHHRQVALKVLRDDLTASLGKERFLREVMIAAGLSHPHVVALYDSGEAAGKLFYVMPFVDGPSLRQRLMRAGEFPIVDAVRVLRDVADAIAYAHKRGVVHRDLKPENVMLTERHALVTDFGVAKALSDATGRHMLTSVGVALGTPAYMSPEQATADPETDHRSDIYSFGVLAYELLTGRTPFGGGSPHEMLAAHVTAPPSPLMQHRPATPPALAKLVMRCLEKKPSDRFESADELIRQLETLLTPGDGVTPHDTAPEPRTAPPRRARRPVLIGGIVALLSIVGVLLVWRGAGRSGAPLLSTRVAVMRFENRTGVDSLDAFGVMLADVITNDLARSGAVDVAPAATVLALQGSAVKDVDTSDPRFIAAESRAGLVVTGNYFRQGDSLAVQSQIVDATAGRPAMPVDLVLAPLEDERTALQIVRERVLVAISALRSGVVVSAALSELPKSLRAYREFVTGLQLHLHANEPARAIPHYRRALALDSTSASAVLMLALAEWNANEAVARTDSLLQFLQSRAEQLPPADARLYEHLRAWVAGEPEGIFRASARYSEVVPEVRAFVVQDAYRANRWNEAWRRARDGFRLRSVRSMPRAWEMYTEVLHHRGDYQRELAEARSGIREAGESDLTVWLELRALAALGDVDAVRDRLAVLRNLNGRSDFLWRTVQELQVHGHGAGARAVGTSVADWYRAATAVDTTAIVQHRLGRALFTLDRTREAESVFVALVGRDATSVHDLGMLGVIMARRGNGEATEKIIVRLGAITTPYLFGWNVAWQGFVAVAKGQCDRAVAYFADATRKGTPYTAYWEEPLVAPIADCPAFQRFMRPKD